MTFIIIKDHYSISIHFANVKSYRICRLHSMSPLTFAQLHGRLVEKERVGVKLLHIKRKNTASSTELRLTVAKLFAHLAEGEDRVHRGSRSADENVLWKENPTDADPSSGESRVFRPPSKNCSTWTSSNCACTLGGSMGWRKIEPRVVNQMLRCIRQRLLLFIAWGWDAKPSTDITTWHNA